MLTDSAQSQNDFLQDQVDRMPRWMIQIIARETGCSDSPCAECTAIQASWRCLDCLGSEVYCTKCFRERHQHLPFHRVENWNGFFFKSSWLCQAGLELYLGHHGNRCPSTLAGNPSEPNVAEGSNEYETVENILDESEHSSGDEDDLETARPEDLDAPEEEEQEDEGDNDEDVRSSTMHFRFDGGDDTSGQTSDEDVCGDEADGWHFEPGDEEAGWEFERECRTKKRAPHRDVEYGNGLPAVKGGVTFIDTSGVHRLKVNYCSCPGRKDCDEQFVEMGFLPASITRPSTAFTFQVLDDFRETNLVCNTAGTSYWNKIVRKTTNVFPGSVPVSSHFNGKAYVSQHLRRIDTVSCYGASGYGGSSKSESGMVLHIVLSGKCQTGALPYFVLLVHSRGLTCQRTGRKTQIGE